MDIHELWKKASDAEVLEKDPQNALKYYQQIVVMYPKSIEAVWAKQAIGKLSEGKSVSTELAASDQPTPAPAPHLQASDYSSKDPGNPQQVVVVNFDMPFWSLVLFLVKVAIASIPATIIVFIIFTVLSSVLGGIVLALLSRR